MRCIIFLHSTTGNTKHVARYALKQLQAVHGVDCVLQNIVKEPEVPNLDDVDLIGIACPTMYFRPTYAMERFVARLPSAPGGTRKPAFLLATAGGDLGAHFELLTEQLAHKDWAVVDGLMIPAVNNWPSHRAAVAKLAPLEPVAHRLASLSPMLRMGLAFLWPDVSDVGDRAPRRIDELCERVLDLAERWAATNYAEAPKPSQLPHGPAPSRLLGLLMVVEHMQQATNIEIDASRCSCCGTCVGVCPVGCLSRDAEDAVPMVGATCTGCWACFNHCPEDAMSGWIAPAGRGKFKGSRRAREVLRHS